MTRCHRTLIAALTSAALLAATAGAAPPEQQSPLPNPTGCDTVDVSACLLPFPNDLYTKADPSTDTGRRVDLNLLAMPRNIAGKPIDQTDHNRADGFSPGSLIVTKIAGLDTDAQLDALDVARVWSPEASQRADAPIVVINARTGEKHMVFAELDHSQDALGADPATRTLLIRPAKNFLEGERYIVALRLPGVAVDPTFANFRDKGTPFTNPFDEQRRAHFEDVFTTLGGAGIARGDLTQAWDFTVASADSLAGRMLEIRDDAFAQLGDENLADLKVEGDAPAFTLTRITDHLCEQGIGFPEDALVVSQCPKGEDGPIAYDVKGTMDVPCYLSTPGCAPAHSQFVLDPVENLPVQIPGNVMKVDFTCRIPKVAVEQGMARPSLYGHGLLGSQNEIGQGQLKAMMAEHNFVFCATNWAGMATEDLPNVATILADMSNFNTLADRVQQGMLNFLYLGRLMIHPEGLSSQAAFKSADGTPILDTRRLFYDGNSQGGIIGGALAAVAPDHTRAVLGVTGMNYSTLLNRSVDFGAGKPPIDGFDPEDPTGSVEYAYPLYQSYPQANERQLLFSLVQMLWDRAESNGYAQHMSADAYPNTPEHRILSMVGYADHQVSNMSAEVGARTMGAKVLKFDMLRPHRAWTIEPFVGLDEVQNKNDDTSVFTVWDGGSRPVPNTNTTIDKTVEDDPHEWIRNTPWARAMKAAFLHIDSEIIDTCKHNAPGGFCETEKKSPQADFGKDPLEQDGVSRP
ncbi:MAG: hypothetical protein WKF96_20790 [Solirubrobacteraceae bacterium]